MAVDAGIFRAIDDFGGGIDLSDYIEPVLNYYTIGGRVYSIPFNSSSPILYANEARLERAGLSATDLPETFGELLEACATAEAAGVTEACITFALHTWFFEQWVAQQGASLVNNGNGREGRATEVLLTSDAALRVGQFMKDHADGGYYSYTGRYEDWAGSEAIFGNQLSLYFITSTADASNQPLLLVVGRDDETLLPEAFEAAVRPHHLTGEIVEGDPADLVHSWLTHGFKLR